MDIIVFNNKAYESLNNGALKFLYEEKHDEPESMDFPDRTCGCENFCCNLWDYDDKGMAKGGWD